mgnify:CR=1 FL=1
MSSGARALGNQTFETRDSRVPAAAMQRIGDMHGCKPCTGDGVAQNGETLAHKSQCRAFPDPEGRLVHKSDRLGQLRTITLVMPKLTPAIAGNQTACNAPSFFETLHLRFSLRI